MTASEAALEPEVIAIGLSRAIRIRRIGATYLIENLHLTRHIDAGGNETVGERWKVVAKAAASVPPGPKPPKQEAFEWMHEAQRKVLALKH